MSKANPNQKLSAQRESWGLIEELLVKITKIRYNGEIKLPNNGLYFSMR